MNTIATIDLGTNTFHLLITEITKGTPIVLFQETFAVKLGEGGITRGHINNAAFERGMKAMESFQQSIEHYGVQQIRAVATSALRSASNGLDFLERIRTKTGIIPEIITGDREAELIYHGVRAAINIEEEYCLIMDIGGGSVEFIICNSKQIFWKKSFDIGTARLIEQFHHSDPIAEADIEKLFAYLENTLFKLNQKLGDYQPTLLIGSAGVFETYAQLINPEFNIDFKNPKFQIDLIEFKRITEIILKSTHAQRSRNLAIIPLRVDMIITATLLTQYILQLHNFQEMKLSTYSLKEGLLFEWIDLQK